MAKRKHEADVAKTLHIVFVLDKSGSMNSVRDATIKGFNEYVQALKADHGDVNAFVTLVTFNGDVSTVFSKRPLAELEEIGEADYCPGGTTALYDGVGNAISSIRPVLDCPNCGKDSTALVIIITDGWENASKIHSRSSVAMAIEHLRGTGKWTFVFVGTTEDVFKAQTDWKLSSNTTMTWTTQDPDSLKIVYRSIADGTSRYIADGCESSDTFFTGRP